MLGEMAPSVLGLDSNGDRMVGRGLLDYASGEDSDGQPCSGGIVLVLQTGSQLRMAWNELSSPCWP